MAYNSSVKHLVREVLIWIAVAGAGFSGVYYFEDARTVIAGAANMVMGTDMAASPEPAGSTSGSERTVRLRATQGGHFAATARINGRAVSMMADTGATLVTLTYEDARRAGFSHAELDFSGRSRTANGVARVARVMLDRVRVGDITVRNVPALVAEPEKLHINLLGMSFIGRLKSFQMTGKELVLIQ